MANQPVGVAVVGEADTAVVAAFGMTAAAAQQCRGVAPAIEQDKNLLLVVQALGNRSSQDIGDDHGLAMFLKLLPHVDHLDGREWIAADEYTIADMAIMPWLRDPAKQGIDIANYANLERWRDKIWQRPQAVKALETLAEHRRKSNAHSDKQWEIMFGKTQSLQGQAAE